MYVARMADVVSLLQLHVALAIGNRGRTACGHFPQMEIKMPWAIKAAGIHVPVHAVA